MPFGINVVFSSNIHFFNCRLFLLLDILHQTFYKHERVALSFLCHISSPCSVQTPALGNLLTSKRFSHNIVQELECLSHFEIQIHIHAVLIRVQQQQIAWCNDSVTRHLHLTVLDVRDTTSLVQFSFVGGIQLNGFGLSPGKFLCSEWWTLKSVTPVETFVFLVWHLKYHVCRSTRLPVLEQVAFVRGFIKMVDIDIWWWCCQLQWSSK